MDNVMLSQADLDEVILNRVALGQARLSRQGYGREG